MVSSQMDSQALFPAGFAVPVAADSAAEYSALRCHGFPLAWSGYLADSLVVAIDA